MTLWTTPYKFVIRSLTISPPPNQCICVRVNEKETEGLRMKVHSSFILYDKIDLFSYIIRNSYGKIIRQNAHQR